MDLIYLDNNATTPLLPAVWEAMRPFAVEAYGNPASAHAAGRRARRGLEDAREQTAALLGAHPDEVVFTSGATEANNLALFGLAGDPPGRPPRQPRRTPVRRRTAAPARRRPASPSIGCPSMRKASWTPTRFPASMRLRHAPARGDAGQPRNRGGPAGARPGANAWPAGPLSTATRPRRSARSRSTSTTSASRRWR